MTTPYTFTFTAPAERLTMNKRYHWTKQRQLTRWWRQMAKIQAKNHKAHDLPPSLVQVTFNVPDKRRRDPHNTAPTVKAIVDGLVDAGCWKDDTPEWVRVMDPLFRKAPDNLVTVECWPMDLTTEAA